MAPKDRRTAPSPLLSGDYQYMTEGYYACQEAQFAGADPMPACADTLDAYVVPIALEKAAKRGLAVPDWLLTNEYFPVPAVCYGVNPFSRRYAVVRTEEERLAAVKRLTWNFKYTVCCQRIGETTEIVEFHMAGGRAENDEFAGWAEQVFRVFRVPIANVRLLRNGSLQLSAIEPLPWRKLTARERAWAAEAVEKPRG